MSAAAVSYLAGMLLVFLGQRVLDGRDAWQTGLTVLGLVGLAAAAGLRVRAGRRETDAGRQAGQRLALRLGLGGVGAVAIYALGADPVVDGLGLEGEAARRWAVSAAAVWPVVWLACTLPLLLVDRALRWAPVVPPRRIREAAGHALGAALGFSLVFPLNYLAHRHNERWELAYFRTTQAGSATQAVVASLDEPIVVHVFLPPASEVADELHGYFDALVGDKLEVRWVDQAAEPRLAQALSVRSNGYIAFSRGEVSLEPPEEGAARPVVQSLRVGEELDKAKRTLAKLDEEVQKILLELGKGERIAYVTTGHGELTWKGGGEGTPPDRRLRGLKAILEFMSFEVKTLGPTEGLVTDVPEDADVVLVLGPIGPFQPAEVDTLRRWLDRGGALLLALEPTALRGAEPQIESTDALPDLLREFGFSMGAGVLASEINIVPLTRNKTDRIHILTDKFSSHASTAVLSKTSPLVPLYLPGAGWLDRRGADDAEVTITVRSRPENWADLDGDYERDEGSETAEMRPVAAAIRRGGEGGGRVLLAADSGAFSDAALGNDGNKQFAFDGINWLIGAENLGGRIENEEDVKIEHSKEDQTLWFYLTVLAVPLMVMGVATVRVRRRKRSR
jgi:hypothetical protein